MGDREGVPGRYPDYLASVGSMLYIAIIGWRAPISHAVRIREIPIAGSTTRFLSSYEFQHLKT